MNMTWSKICVVILLTMTFNVLLFLNYYNFTPFIHVFKNLSLKDNNDFQYIYWSSDVSSVLPHCKEIFSRYPLFKPVLSIIDLQRISKLLITFDRLCKTAGINYISLAGTRLGAVRHNGPIPYDDDIDIGILEADREKMRNFSLLLRNYKISIVSWNNKWKFNHINESIYIKGFPYRWPFLDIFFFKNMKNGNICILEDNLNFCITRKQFANVKRIKFLNLKIPILNQERLDPISDKNSLDICISRSYNHRFERFERIRSKRLPCKKLSQCLPFVKVISKSHCLKTKILKIGNKSLSEVCDNE